MDFDNWKSYAADTLQNIQNLDSLAEQDEYIKSPDLNVVTAAKLKGSSITDYKDDYKEKEKAITVTETRTVKNEILSSNSSSSSFLDEKLPLKVSSHGAEVNETQPAVDANVVNRRALMSSAVEEMIKPTRVDVVKEDNDWSLLDVPWQVSTSKDKVTSKRNDEINLIPVLGSTTHQNDKDESNKNRSNNTTNRTQQMSMLSVVSSLMQELSSPTNTEQHSTTKENSNENITKASTTTASMTIEDKMNLSSKFMKTLEFFNQDDLSISDEEDDDQDNNTETDELLKVTPTALPLPSSDTDFDSKRDKTVWFDVFDEENSKNSSLVCPRPGGYVTSLSPLHPTNTTPPTTTSSLFQNIPLFQKISQSKTIQSLTQSLANVRPNNINPKRTTPQHLPLQSPTESATTTSSSKDNIFLSSSSSVMKLEDTLEWQRLQQQHAMHPLVFIKNKLSICLKQYGFVLFTLFVALFVYFYSRKKVIDRVS